MLLFSNQRWNMNCSTLEDFFLNSHSSRTLETSLCFSHVLCFYSDLKFISVGGKRSKVMGLQCHERGREVDRGWHKTFLLWFIERLQQFALCCQCGSDSVRFWVRFALNTGSNLVIFANINIGLTPPSPGGPGGPAGPGSPGFPSFPSGPLGPYKTQMAQRVNTPWHKQLLSVQDAAITTLGTLQELKASQFIIS